MEMFSDDRPIARAPVNIHEVLEHVRRVARSGFARHLRFIETYDPSLPPVYGNRDLLIQALLNAWPFPAAAAGSTCRWSSESRTTVRAYPRTCVPTCSIPSSPPRSAARDWAWRWSPRSWATMAAWWNSTAGRGERCFV
jgi:two-component system nitrogen regulation sensor histidine kinase GlnL